MNNYLFTVEKFAMSLKITNKTFFNLRVCINNLGIPIRTFIIPPLKFGMINDDQLDITKLTFNLERSTCDT